MPKLCEGCGFYSPDNAPTQCPSCDAALKFTFLPPAGKAATPLAGVANDPYADLERKQRAARAGLFGIDWRIVKAVAAALVTVGIIGVRFWLRQEARDEREQRQTVAAAQIRPGMHISEAARLFHASSNMPGSRRKAWDDFDPDDDSDGSMEVNDGRQDLKVTWENGFVTSVEQSDGSGGTRRRATTTPAPADEDEVAPPTNNRPVVHPAERLVAPPGSGR